MTVLLAQHAVAGDLSAETGEQASIEVEEKPIAGYQDGQFFLRSRDGRFELTPQLVMQLQYRTRVIEETDNTHDIFLRRARVILRGHAFTPDFKYKLQFGMGTKKTDTPHFDLKDLFASYRVIDYVIFKGGQFKVPFGFQTLTSARKLQFIERSLADNEFSPGRDIGISLMGGSAAHLIQYSVGIFNGEGKNELNADGRFLYAGRVVFNPLGKYLSDESDLGPDRQPRLSLGAEGFYNKDDSAGDHIVTLGAYAGIKYEGFSLRGEYFRRLNLDDRSTSVSDVDAQGYFAQAGYFAIPEKLEFALRASHVLRSVADNDESEYSVGINYFIKQQRLKFQVGYSLELDEEAISGTDNQLSHIFRTQFQLYI